MTNEPKTGFRAVFRREWSMLANSPGLQVLHFFGPVAVILILWAVFSQQVLRDLPISVVDADQSSASRQLTRMIDAAPGVRVADEFEKLSEAEATVRKLDAYGIVFIPENFGHDIKARRAVTVTCFYNAQLSSSGSTVNRDVGAAVRTFDSQIQAGRLVAGGIPLRLVSTRLQPIASQGAPLFNPQQSYEVFLFTAFTPTVLQLFILLATIWAVGTELRNSTARQWLDAAGGSMIKAAAGKLSLYFLLYALIALAALFGIHGWMGWGADNSSWLLVIGLLAFVAACQSLAVLFIGVIANLRSALSIGSLLAGPAFGFSGISLPDYTMSGPAIFVHNLIPLSPYLRLYGGQAFRGAGFHAWWPDFGILCLFVTVGLGLGLLKLRKACIDPKKWGAQ